jgi:hypothetical protein
MNLKTQLRIITALVIGLSFPSHAEVALENNSGLIGKWAIAGLAKDFDGEKRLSSGTWEFRRDGALLMKGDDKRLSSGTFDVQTSYRVEDGKIVADTVGRPGKTTTYSVIEMDAHSLIIKRQMGPFQWFTK